MVADDGPEIRAFVTEVLEDGGYEVQAVGDGLTALVAIQADPPALALLDVAMPVMIGDKTLRQLRAEGFSLPVVIMTAGMHPQRFLQLGATAVLGKPFLVGRLLTIIAQALASGQ